MIKAINNLTFGWNAEKAAKNRMSKRGESIAQTRKALVLEGEKLDYFVRKHYGIKKENDYKSPLMKDLNGFIQTLKETEDEIIKILRVHDKNIRKKHNIAQDKNDYVCPINKETNRLLKVYDSQIT